MRTVTQTILRLALALGFFTGAASADSPDTAAALEKLTGGRVKVVWHQNIDLLLRFWRQPSPYHQCPGAQ